MEQFPTLLSVNGYIGYLACFVLFTIPESCINGSHWAQRSHRDHLLVNCVKSSYPCQFRVCMRRTVSVCLSCTVCSDIVNELILCTILYSQLYPPTGTLPGGTLYRFLMSFSLHLGIFTSNFDSICTIISKYEMTEFHLWLSRRALTRTMLDKQAAQSLLFWLLATSDCMQGDKTLL